MKLSFFCDFNLIFFVVGSWSESGKALVASRQKDGGKKYANRLNSIKGLT